MPQPQVRNVFERFQQGVASVPDYRPIARGNEFVRSISSELNFDTVPG